MRLLRLEVFRKARGAVMVLATPNGGWTITEGTAKEMEALRSKLERKYRERWSGPTRIRDALLMLLADFRCMAEEELRRTGPGDAGKYGGKQGESGRRAGGE